jgi:hypothetical protein
MTQIMKKIQNKETGTTEKKAKEPNPAIFFRFVVPFFFLKLKLSFEYCQTRL